MSDHAVCICPACGEETRVEQRVTLACCSHCGSEFFVSRTDENLEHEVESFLPADALDARRIAQLASVRRATMRGRSYTLIVAIACGFVAVQSTVLAARHLFHHPPSLLWGTGFAAIAVAAACGSWSLAARAAQTSREMRLPTEHTEAVEPDFSTLSDGSQQAQNLENVR